MVELGEKLEDAAHREIYEECGIKIKKCRYIDIFEFITKDETQRIKYHYIIFEFLANYSEGKLIASSDVDDADWFVFDDLKALNTTQDTKDLIERVFS